MTTLTTNMALAKAADGDNSKVYLETNLGAALDTLDAHDHSLANGSKGKPINTIPSGGLVITGGLAIPTGNVILGASSANLDAQLKLQGALGANSTTQQILSLTTTFPSGTTLLGSVYRGGLQTVAAAFTMASGYVYHSEAPTLGAASAVTTLVGHQIDNQAGAGITNAYGVRIANQTGSTLNCAIDAGAGGDCFMGAGALANTATNGFLYVASGTTAPTGVPAQTALHSTIPIRFNSGDNKLYAYIGGSWLKTAAFT